MINHVHLSSIKFVVSNNKLFKESYVKFFLAIFKALYMYIVKGHTMNIPRGCHGCDRMVVGFTTTCAISTYHHWSCEFESCSGEVYSIQHYVMKFVSDLRQAGGFLWALRFLPSIKLTTMIHFVLLKYCWKWH